MRALIIAAALALGAPCAFAQEAAPPVTAAQNGQTVEVAQGGKLVIQLAVNPSTGAHWDVAEKPDFLGDAAISVARPTLAPGERPRLGAPQQATITFDVTGAGSGDVVLEKRGPGGDGAVQDTFRVTVTAQ